MGQTDRERWVARTAKSGTGVASIRADWSGMSLMQKRAYIEEMLSAVIVLPAHGRPGFHADRLELAWRE